MKADVSRLFFINLFYILFKQNSNVNKRGVIMTLEQIKYEFAYTCFSEGVQPLFPNRDTMTQAFGDNPTPDMIGESIDKELFGINGDGNYIVDDVAQTDFGVVVSIINQETEEKIVLSSIDFEGQYLEFNSHKRNQREDIENEFGREKDDDFGRVLGG